MGVNNSKPQNLHQKSIISSDIWTPKPRTFIPKPAFQQWLVSYCTSKFLLKPFAAGPCIASTTTSTTGLRWLCLEDSDVFSPTVCFTPFLKLFTPKTLFEWFTEFFTMYQQQFKNLFLQIHSKKLIKTQWPQILVTLRLIVNMTRFLQVCFQDDQMKIQISSFLLLYSKQRQPKLFDLFHIVFLSKLFFPMSNAFSLLHIQINSLFIQLELFCSDSSNVVENSFDLSSPSAFSASTPLEIFQSQIPSIFSECLTYLFTTMKPKYGLFITNLFFEFTYTQLKYQGLLNGKLSSSSDRILSWGCQKQLSLSDLISPVKKFPSSQTAHHSIQPLEFFLFGCMYNELSTALSVEFSQPEQFVEQILEYVSPDFLAFEPETEESRIDETEMENVEHTSTQDSEIQSLEDSSHSQQHEQQHPHQPEQQHPPQHPPPQLQKKPSFWETSIDTLLWLVSPQEIDQKTPQRKKNPSSSVAQLLNNIADALPSEQETDNDEDEDLTSFNFPKDPETSQHISNDSREKDGSSPPTPTFEQLIHSSFGPHLIDFPAPQPLPSIIKKYQNSPYIPQLYFEYETQINEKESASNIKDSLNLRKSFACVLHYFGQYSKALLQYKQCIISEQFSSLETFFLRNNFGACCIMLNEIQDARHQLTYNLTQLGFFTDNNDMELDNQSILGLKSKQYGLVAATSFYLLAQSYKTHPCKSQLDYLLKCFTIIRWFHSADSPVASAALEKIVQHPNYHVGLKTSLSPQELFEMYFSSDISDNSDSEQDVEHNSPTQSSAEPEYSLEDIVNDPFQFLTNPPLPQSKMYIPFWLSLANNFVPSDQPFVLRDSSEQNQPKVEPISAGIVYPFEWIHRKQFDMVCGLFTVLFLRVDESEIRAIFGKLSDSLQFDICNKPTLLEIQTIFSEYSLCENTGTLSNSLSNQFVTLGEQHHRLTSTPSNSIMFDEPNIRTDRVDHIDPGHPVDMNDIDNHSASTTANSEFIPAFPFKLLFSSFLTSFSKSSISFHLFFTCTYSNQWFDSLALRSEINQFIQALFFHGIICLDSGDKPFMRHIFNLIGTIIFASSQNPDLIRNLSCLHTTKICPQQGLLQNYMAPWVVSRPSICSLPHLKTISNAQQVALPVEKFDLDLNHQFSLSFQAWNSSVKTQGSFDTLIKSTHPRKLSPPNHVSYSNIFLQGTLQLLHSLLQNPHYSGDFVSMTLYVSTCCNLINSCWNIDSLSIELYLSTILIFLRQATSIQNEIEQEEGNSSQEPRSNSDNQSHESLESPSSHSDNSSLKPIFIKSFLIDSAKCLIESLIHSVAGSTIAFSETLEKYTHDEEYTLAEKNPLLLYHMLNFFSPDTIEALLAIPELNDNVKSIQQIVNFVNMGIQQMSLSLSIDSPDYKKCIEFISTIAQNSWPMTEKDSNPILFISDSQHFPPKPREFYYLLLNTICRR